MMRLIGAAPIIAADLSPDRCAMALAAGADAAIADPADLRDTVLRLTDGRGADIVIESVGHPALYEQAFALIRKGGHVAAFGLAAPGQTVPLDLLRTVLQETSVKGSVAGMGCDMRDALTLLAHGRIRTAPFAAASFPLARIQLAFETIPDRPADLKTQIAI
jgi:threonine dehydrogenase-like Zn-dependent dehydrogenase